MSDSIQDLYGQLVAQLASQQPNYIISQLARLFYMHPPVSMDQRKNVQVALNIVKEERGNFLEVFQWNAIQSETVEGYYNRETAMEFLGL